MEEGKWRRHAEFHAFASLRIGMMEDVGYVWITFCGISFVFENVYSKVVYKKGIFFRSVGKNY